MQVVAPPELRLVGEQDNELRVADVPDPPDSVARKLTGVTPLMYAITVVTDPAGPLPNVKLVEATPKLLVVAHADDS